MTMHDEERQPDSDPERRGVGGMESLPQTDSDPSSGQPGRTDAERQADAERLVEEEGLLGIEGAVPPREEASFLNLRTLFISAMGLLAMIVFVLLVSLVLYAFFARITPTGVDPAPQTTPGTIGVGPGLHFDEVGTYQRLRATQQAMISEYAWIDRQQGRVRIPIERAIEHIARQGLPVQPEVVPMTPAPVEPDESGFPPGTPAPVEPPAPGEAADPVQAGANLFQDFGCNSCHMEVDTALAPTIHGIYGEEEVLDTGETILVDDDYLRESILSPQNKIVAGYQPVMPSYQGQMSEEQLTAIIAYIRSLGDQ